MLGDYMKYQEPAQGILKTRDFGSSVFYKVTCECGQPDCDMDFEIEADDDLQDIMMNLWVEPKSDWWRRLVKENHHPMIENSWLYAIDYNIRSIINGLYHRINITYQLWTQGYIRYYHTTILNKQQAYNFAETIKRSIIELEKRKKNDSYISRENESNHDPLGR